MQFNTQGPRILYRPLAEIQKRKPEWAKKNRRIKRRSWFIQFV